MTQFKENEQNYFCYLYEVKSYLDSLDKESSTNLLNLLVLEVKDYNYPIKIAANNLTEFLTIVCNYLLGRVDATEHEARSYSHDLTKYLKELMQSIKVI